MTIFFPPHQEIAILFLVITGFVCGIFYDVLAVKRKLVGEQYVFLLFDDIIFVLFSVILFLISVFVVNNGIVRWYEFMGFLVRFVFYKLTLSRIVMYIFTRLIIFCKFVFIKFLGVLIKTFFVLLLPFTFVIKLALRCLKKATLPIKYSFIRNVYRYNINLFIGKLKYLGSD